MAFLLFILVTGTLFVRPGEIIPAMRGWEFFFYFIMPCLLLSFESVAGQLSQRSLRTQPITVCVLGMLPAVVISNLAHGNIDMAVDQGWSFIKNLIYYFLLVGLVDRPSRFRGFLFWLWVFCLAFVVLALLQHHGLIELSMEKAVNGSSVSESGEQIVTARMVGSGLFGDPNDMCMVIVTGLILGIYWMGDNLLYAVSLPIFGYGLMQTQSRGGFIAFMAACGVLLLTRYGWKKGAMLLAAGLPALLLVFKGRMTKISTDEGTAHSRIELWGDGLEFFKSSPLFGVGAGKFHELTDDGHVAHNAYVQAYAELGLFGGIFFIGAFYFSLSAIYGMGGIHTEGMDPNIRRAQSIMMALTAGIATLLLTLSQTFYMTTYMIFGLITAYLRITNASKILIGFRVDSSFIKRLLLAGILFLAVLFLFVRFFK